MSLTEKVQRDVVKALKAGEKERLSALRMILSQLQMAGKEARSEYGEEQEMAVLAAEKKRRRQSAEAFRQGGREDRALKEEAEAAIIDEYLPSQLSEAELSALVDEVVTETGASSMKDMGRVMSAAMAKAAGRADGQQLSEAVRQRLS